MIRLTMSGLARADACLGSVVLDGFDEGGKYAATGNAVDAFVQTAKTKSRDLALAQAPEELRPYLAGLTLERIPDGAEYQVAFALNALTGEVRRIPGRGQGYPSDLGSEWIFGTSDIVGVRDGRGLVWDLKWGSYTNGRDPETDLQLGGYSVCVAAVAGVGEVELGFLRAGWDGVLRPDTTVLDEVQLLAMQDRIATIWRRAQDASASPASVRLSPSEDNCTYCRARRGCRAQAQPVTLALQSRFAELAGDALPSPEVVKEKVGALTPEAKGALYARLGAGVDFLKLVRDIIRDDARTSPDGIPLPDGTVLREVLWGTSKQSPTAQAELEALKEDLKARGEIVAVKVPQVRPMKPAKGSRALKGAA